jgi:hypothetical protein
MKKNRRFWKGAISIFLCIILISNVALIGVLVDGGRSRMARAESEAALDGAASSVLSYYNQTLYDLYGLFATDNLSEDKIVSLLTDYTEKTLGTLPVPESTVRQVNDAVYTALTGKTAQEEGKTLFNGYDFQVGVTLDADRGTLANTDAVEAQIIDHMKYRAPIALASGTADFLDKVNGLFKVFDRVKDAKDKADTTASLGKDQLAKDNAALIQRISDFNKKMRSFTLLPYDPDGAPASGSCADPWSYIDTFDKAMDKAWQDNESTGESADQSAVEEAYDDAQETLLNHLNAIAQNAKAYHEEANGIRDDAQAMADRYKSYIAALQAKIDADPSNQNLKTVYLPEIQLAQSACGEMLKNMDLVLMGRQYTEDISSSMDDYENIFEMLCSLVKDFRMNGMDENQKEEGASIYLRKVLEREYGNFGGAGNTLITALAQDLRELYSFVGDFREADPVSIQTAQGNKDAGKEETTPKVDGLRTLNADDLQVDYQKTEQQDWYKDVPTTVSESDTSAILQAGLDFIGQIKKVLEGARDSLYINEYAAAYFPNYVQHYRATTKPIATEADNAYLSGKGSFYTAFCATQPELEYVVTGDSNVYTSVANISARLLGIRMALNTAAIFTDTAKVTQANAMAACAGPFAPLVAVGLLIAWALAESAMDVADLLTGEEVYLFKQGANWTISAAGLLKKGVGKLVGFVSDEVAAAVKKSIDTGADAVEQAADQAIYEAYDSLSSGADAAVNKARGSLQQWGQGVQQQMTQAGYGSQASGLAGAAAGSAGSQASQLIQGTLSNASDRALAMVDQTVKNISTDLKDQVDSFSADVQAKITDFVAGSLASILPAGQVAATGKNEGTGFDVKLDYMDYMRLFLLFLGNTTKVQRLQSLIQANLRYGGQQDFSMAGSYVSISAHLDGSIGFLMMSAAVMPPSLRQNGRMNFRVYTTLGY